MRLLDGASRLGWHRRLTFNGTHASRAHVCHLRKKLWRRLTARHSLALQCHPRETLVPFSERRDKAAARVAMNDTIIRSVLKEGEVLYEWSRR